MTWLVAVLLVLVLGAVALLAAGPGGTLQVPERDHPRHDLPQDGPVSAADLRRVRFPLAFRGYRMTDVDALLDRVARQLDTSERAAPEE